MTQQYNKNVLLAALILAVLRNNGAEGHGHFAEPFAGSHIPGVQNHPLQRNTPEHCNNESWSDNCPAGAETTAPSASIPSPDNCPWGRVWDDVCANNSGFGDGFCPQKSWNAPSMCPGALPLKEQDLPYHPGKKTVCAGPNGEGPLGPQLGLLTRQPFTGGLSGSFETTNGVRHGTYKAGQPMEVAQELHANHGGAYAYFLIFHNESNQDESQEYFAEHPLEWADPENPGKTTSKPGQHGARWRFFDSKVSCSGVGSCVNANMATGATYEQDTSGCICELTNHHGNAAHVVIYDRVIIPKDKSGPATLLWRWDNDGNYQAYVGCSEIYVEPAFDCADATFEANCQACGEDGKCAVPDEGHYIVADGRAKSCSDFDASCTECTLNDQCTSCDAGFGLVDSGCIACVDNCDQCDGGSCSECKDEFWLNGTSCDTCLDIFPECGTCSDTGVCETCSDDNSVLNGDASACIVCDIENCDKCVTGAENLTCEVCNSNELEVDPATGQCIERVSNCPRDQYCSSQSSNNCEGGVNCHPCTQYNADGVCDTCVEGKCTSCSTGYLLTVNKLCYAAPIPGWDADLFCPAGTFVEPNSTTCEEAPAPITCPPEAGAGCTACNESGECLNCSERYVLDDGACMGCPGDCLDCNADLTCNECTSGHYVFLDGSCAGCAVMDPDCATCVGDNTATCLSCLNGKIINPANPSECIEEPTSPGPSPPVDGEPLPLWHKCGGNGWTGSTNCGTENSCVVQSEWYSQCQPGGVRN